MGGTLFISKQSQNPAPDPDFASEIEQLRTRLYTDDLTGLYNRRFFRHCVAEQKDHSDTTGTPFSLLLVDLDHFKQINDRNGHAEGDRILVNIAGLLREEFHDQGWVFRYDGDEFVGILPTGNEDKIQNFCSRILQKLSEICGSEKESTANVSLGYAIYPNATRNIGDLLETACRALRASRLAAADQIHAAAHMDIIDEQGLAITLPSPILIGRQREWNRLLQYLLACRKGQGGRIVMITGETGIGKSRFIRGFLRCQRTSDYHILYGECDQSTVGVPYAPIRTALKKGFEAKDPATVNVFKELDESRKRALVQLVPQFDRFEKLSGNAHHSSNPELLAESIFLLLEGLSRQLPVVLVMEDLNWCDDATLDLLRRIQKNIATTPILVMTTSESIESRFQLQDTEKSDNVIELKPLSFQENGFLLEEIFQKLKVSAALQKWIYSNTQGIPLQVEQLLKLLVMKGSIEIGQHEINMRTS
jgi:diguanylate cyclase (GGDEF)-like protein